MTTQQKVRQLLPGFTVQEINEKVYVFGLGYDLNNACNKLRAEGFIAILTSSQVRPALLVAEVKFASATKV